MHRFILLLRFTDQGARELTHSPARADAFNEAAKNAGVIVEGQYWSVGHYDGVLIIRSEDERAALRCVTTLTADGHVRAESLKAFTENEFQEILSA